MWVESNLQPSLTMAYYKEHYYNRGLTPVDGSLICWRCIEDYAVRDYILRKASATQCTYCGKRYKRIIAVEIDRVISFILDGLEREYEDAANSVGYESAKGGYLLPTDTTRELVESAFEDEELSQKLISDLVDGLPDCPWVRKHPYSQTDDEEWWSDWELFCRTIKHECRFFFSQKRRRRNRFGERRASPKEMLQRLAEFVEEIRLVQKLPAGASFYRIRCHDPSKAFVTAADLGPPPPEFCVSSNRMSPAGVPMFYGAKELLTAFLETYTKPTASIITVAKFRTTRDILVLDLSNLPPFPSLFDEDRAWSRPMFAFMHAFIRDATTAVEKDGREHVDYVPTQIVSEYFRTVYRFENKKPIRGVFYPSAKCPGGVSTVLFADGRNVVGVDTGYEQYPKLLELIPSSVKRLTPNTIIHYYQNIFHKMSS